MQMYSACRKMSVKQEVGGERMKTFWSDSARRIWPVGPTWTDPGLLNKIKSGLWMVCWALCPWSGVWRLLLEFQNQHKPLIQQTCVSSRKIPFWFQVSFPIPVTQWNNPVIPIFHCPNYNQLTSICQQKCDRIFSVQTTCPNFKFRIHECESYGLSCRRGKGFCEAHSIRS